MSSYVYCRRLIKQLRHKKSEDALVLLQEYLEIGSGQNKSSVESIEYTRRIRREINITKIILAKKKIKRNKHQKQSMIQADMKRIEASKQRSYDKKTRKNRPRHKRKPVDDWKQNQRYLRAMKPKKLSMVQRIVRPPKKSKKSKKSKKGM